MHEKVAAQYATCEHAANKVASARAHPARRFEFIRTVLLGQVHSLTGSDGTHHQGRKASGSGCVGGVGMNAHPQGWCDEGKI